MALRIGGKYQAGAVGTGVEILPQEKVEWPEFRLCYSRLVTHYWANASFLDDDHLIHNAPKLAGIPTYLSHGRLDISSPMDFPVSLSQAIPHAELFISERDGHGGPAMVDNTIAVTDKLAASWHH